MQEDTCRDLLDRLMSDASLQSEFRADREVVLQRWSLTEAERDALRTLNLEELVAATAGAGRRWNGKARRGFAGPQP
jgi:hypothetical protein